MSVWSTCASQVYANVVQKLTSPDTAAGASSIQTIMRISAGIALRTVEFGLADATVVKSFTS